MKDNCATWLQTHIFTGLRITMKNELGWVLRKNKGTVETGNLED